MRFPPKALIVYSENKTEFDYMNNQRCNKLTNFWLDIISKMNFRMLIVMLYISLGLRLKRSQTVQKVFKLFALLLCNC